MTIADTAEAALEKVDEVSTSLVERAKPDARAHPRLAATWQAARPVLKASLYGAAFVGGGLLIARLFGPSTVKTLSGEGGEAFAQGVNRVNELVGGGRGGRRFG